MSTSEPRVSCGQQLQQASAVEICLFEWLRHQPVLDASVRVERVLATVKAVLKLQARALQTCVHANEAALWVVRKGCSSNELVPGQRCSVALFCGSGGDRRLWRTWREVGEQ